MIRTLSRYVTQEDGEKHLQLHWRSISYGCQPCRIGYQYIMDRGAKTDVRPYNFFLVRHKSRTRFRLYGMIYGCTARTKDVRLRKNRSGNKFRKIEKVIDHTGPKFSKFKYLVGLYHHRWHQRAYQNWLRNFQPIMISPVAPLVTPKSKNQL